MEQHAIPQQISSYQFRLVGDMTLKQFFQLAGGILIGLLFYASGLPVLIKWPLIIFFSLLGAAMAFLPFEERPLEKWILAFFKCVYGPTLYRWNQKPFQQKFYQEEALTPAAKDEGVIAPKGEQALNEYLSSLPEQKTSLLAKLNSLEKNFLAKTNILFGPPSPSSGDIPISAPAPKTTAKVEPMVIPRTEPVKIIPEGPIARPKIMVEEKFTPAEPQLTQVAPTITSQGLAGGQAPQFSPGSAPPTPPTIANVVVGQTLDDNGKIIESAIIEIRDIAGRPIRALKSNMLGHFMIVTPLSNGRYEMITEKEGYNFAPYAFEATGKVILPMAIIGKNEPKIITSEDSEQNQPIVSQPN